MNSSRKKTIAPVAETKAEEAKKVEKSEATSMKENSKPKTLNRYEALIEDIFKEHYQTGSTDFEFPREAIDISARKLGITLPKNVGDIVYSFRYRNKLPKYILDTATKGLEWIIEGAGRAKYRFKQVKINRIIPRENSLTIKVPDATPEIIGAYALGDEQALLAKVRYNRLVDIFLGITAYSLQNHLRTTVKNVGQIEIDEIYVGLDKFGRQFVVPVQAKGGKDQHGVVQTQQDFHCCAEKFPGLICRAISAQFLDESRIAMFELTIVDKQVVVVDEKHYQLVSSKYITQSDLIEYGKHIK